MSDIREWTPIQEGRFHLRAMKPGENLRSYMLRAYPAPTYTPALRRERQRRIAPLVKMARAEAKRFKKAGHS